MRRITTGPLFAMGMFCMIVALAMQNITLAGGRYGPLLLTALGLTMFADFLLAVVVWRGGIGWRVMAVPVMLVTLFVIGDFLRRAPYVFGDHPSRPAMKRSPAVPYDDVNR